MQLRKSHEKAAVPCLYKTTQVTYGFSLSLEHHKPSSFLNTLLDSSTHNGLSKLAQRLGESLN